MDCSSSELLRYLSVLQTGQLSHDSAAAVELLLQDCWSKLVGTPAGGMKAEKLSGRTEAMSWNAPTLSFWIERHGTTVLGSKYADIQIWEINVREGVAHLIEIKKRQV